MTNSTLFAVMPLTAPFTFAARLVFSEISGVRIPRTAIRASASLVLAAMSIIRADVIIGNLPPTNNLVGNFFTGESGNMRSKAVGFTMTSTATLDSAALRLRSNASTHAPDVLIMSDSGGNPGAILATLVNPALGLGDQNYVFRASTPLPLLSGATYWLVLRENSSLVAPFLIWFASQPSATPVGSQATFAGARFSSTTFPATAPDSVSNSFQLNSVAAPEPSTLFTLSGGLGGLLLLRLRRRR